MCCCGHTLLKFNEAPSFVVNNPYILSGFRPKQSFKEALTSLFTLHNGTSRTLPSYESSETWNVWTHLAGAFVLLAWLSYSLSTGDDYTTTDTYIVTFAFLSCLVCYLTSAGTGCQVFSDSQLTTFLKTSQRRPATFYCTWTIWELSLLR
jgi:predicted membrane channel-forming protein YqfA (hemolysin III family)